VEAEHKDALTETFQPQGMAKVEQALRKAMGHKEIVIMATNGMTSLPSPFWKPSRDSVQTGWQR